MDPGQDIIDVLYNKDEVEKRGVTRLHSNHGFDYHNPPARNYYDDLFQIQRRQFFHGDSVFGRQMEQKSWPSLLKSSDYHSGNSGSCHFSFPSPSQQEKQRRSLIYGTLLRSSHKNRQESQEELEFVTPESEEEQPIYDQCSSNGGFKPERDSSIVSSEKQESNCSRVQIF